MDKNNMYTYKIYKNTGIVRDNIFVNGEKVLHVGSGSNVLKGAETIDMLDLPGVDTVHNLDDFPWPYADDTFDVIFAQSIVEHLTDIVKVMEEFHRILKKGGRVIIIVPHFRSVDAYTDVTHKHFFTRQSLDYFTNKDTSTAKYQYTKIKFRELGFWYGWPAKSTNILVKLFKSFIKKHSGFYDSHLSLIFPVKIVVWEMEVIK